MLKNRKIVFIFLIVILLFAKVSVLADDEDYEELNESELQEAVVESATFATEEPIINARSAIIYDRSTNEIIWSKNENEKRAMASTTKIMSAIVVLENSNLNDIVTVSKKAAGTGGSKLKINSGDKITVLNLLYGLMLRSRK